MKKLLPGILALLMAFGCMTACGQTPDASTPGESTPPASTPGESTPPASTPEDPQHQHETDLADVKDYLLEQISKKDLSTYKDFTLPTSFSFIGETTKYAITWTSNVTAVTIEAGETEATVKIGKVDEDTAFVLTATVTDPDGCHTTTFTVDGVAEREPQIVPNAISAAPTEETMYKLYMYQVTKAQDLYFTGKMSGFYLATTNVSQGQTYADGVDVYVKAVAGKAGYFNLCYADPDDSSKTMYIGVKNYYNNGKWRDNVVLADSTTVEAGVNGTFEFTYSEQYGTMIATLDGVKSGADEATTETKTDSFWLGTDGTYYTFGAMSVSTITKSDACIGKLVEMVDKSTIVVPASKKVADVKASLSIGTQYTLDKEIELTVADERYDDVTITWAVEGAGATIADGKLSLTIPAEKATVTLTATIACGETTDTKEFTLELGPKTVVPEDKTDAAAIVAAAYNLAAGETLPGGTYTLTGEITEVNKAWDAGYSNITVTITVGDKTFECYRLKSGDADASVLKVGDTITVSGTIKNYNGKVEFDAGCILDAVVAGEGEEGGDEGDDEVVGSSVVLTVDALAIPDQAYKTEETTATVDGVSFGFIQIGNYGNGLQWRTKDGLSGSLWNTTTNGNITKIVFNPNQTKMGDYQNAYTLALGNTAACDEKTVDFTTDGKNVVTLTIEGDYTYFKITHANTYTQYFDSIEVFFAESTDVTPPEGGDTPVEPEEPETPDVPEIQTLTIAEAIAKAAEQGAGKYTTEMYYVIGKITEVQNSTYGNVMISDGTNEILVYGMYLQNDDGSKGARYDKMETKPVVGDTVKLLSVVGMYNTTKQLKDAFLIEITAATDAEKVAAEKDALTLTDAVTGATSISLAANGASRAEVAISWEVTAGNEIATIADGKLEITNPTAETTVTVKATITCGESIDSKTFDIVVSVLEAGEAAVIVADFNTLNSNSSYGSATTTNGWKVVNAAIQKNGTANSGDSFAIVPADTKAVCLNGKTTAVGKLTSPTITTGVSKISFNYAYFFSEANGVNITISVKDASGNIVTSHNMTIPSSAIAKLTAYSYEWVLGTAVTEDCTIEVVNNSPSKNTGNKDRLSIWNFTVTGVVS